MNPLTRAATWAITNPLGEEITEGVVGGGLAGLGMIGTDQSPEDIAIKTGAAMLGGVGLGIGGRRLGAFLGRRFHPQDLKNQSGMLSTVGRMVGSETTFGPGGGLQQQATMGKAAIQDALLNESSHQLAVKAAYDPIGFAEQYGISADVFNKELSRVQTGMKAASLNDVILNLPAEKRKEIAQAALKDYAAVEDLIRNKASTKIDKGLESLLNDENMMNQAQQFLDESGAGGNLKESLSALIENKVPAVSGEQVGRAVGRMAGDEAGIMLGLLTGNIITDNFNEN